MYVLFDLLLTDLHYFTFHFVFLSCNI